MPHYTTSLEIACSLADLFAFLARPKNLAQLAPPDWHLELLAAPETMERGSRLVWKGRRWGVSQSFTHEVATFELEKCIVMEQKQGPFARWVHAHHFEAIEAGTRLREEIDFGPPSGILGRLVTTDVIRRDLDKMYVYRERMLKEIIISEPRTP